MRHRPFGECEDPAWSCTLIGLILLLAIAGFFIAWLSSQKRSSSRINRMRKRGGKVPGEARQLPKEQTVPPHIKSWQPSRMQTGLKNHLIGRKVSLVVRRTT